MGDLSVRKLHPCLGAEVRGVDFTKPLSDNAVEEILGAWADHLVLIFPDQPVTDQQHVDVTRYFGEPEVFHQDILKSTSVAEIFRVSNTDEDGNIMPATHPTMKQLSGARKWHTDSSYREKPAVGSLFAWHRGQPHWWTNLLHQHVCRLRGAPRKPEVED